MAKGGVGVSGFAIQDLATSKYLGYTGWDDSRCVRYATYHEAAKALASMMMNGDYARIVDAPVVPVTDEEARQWFLSHPEYVISPDCGRYVCHQPQRAAYCYMGSGATIEDAIRDAKRNLEGK